MLLDQHLAQAPLVTMDELMRAYARLPLTDADGQEIVDCFAVRLRAGRRLSVVPLDSGLDDASPEAKRFLVQRISAQGLALVTSFDLHVTLLIIKTDVGKGLFGRQKVAYSCFVTESGDGFERAGTVPTIPRAFGILDTMYEVVEAADRLTR